MRAEEAKMRAAFRRGEIDDVTKPENKTARYKELEKQFDDLVKSERDILEKNEYDRIYTKEGGSNENAFTNNDMTVYFIAVPKNRLELWFWMEADRLMQPVFREFYSERDVVFEERRMRTESTPTGRLEEAFDEMFWHGHPYTWPVVGYPSDIPAITKPQADEYYSLFYAPNNITTVLVGDFDPKEAVRLAEKYFGRIARGKNPPPEMTVLPPKWEAEMRFHGEADTNPEVYVVWHTVGFQHKDAYPLQVLAQLLNGRTGRLFKSLVDAKPAEKNVASTVASFQNSQKYAGSFGIDGEVKEGKTPEELERGIDAEVERLKTDLVPDRELQKVKNNFNAAAYRRLSANFPIMVQLLVNDGLGDWHELNEAPKKIQAVTAEDVRRVAKAYLTKENRAVATFTRKAGAPSADDAALADVPAEARPMVKQRLQQIGAETDAEKLKATISRLEGQAPQAPPEMKKTLDLMLQKARARLEELSAGTTANKEKK
jgi:predicted Zn-dependent peptidase